MTTRAAAPVVPAPHRADRRARVFAFGGRGVATMRHNRVAQVGVAMILVQLAYRIWATSQSWYTFDDFAFMSRAFTDGIRPSVLIEPYAGHVMPAGMFLSWLSATISPYNFLITGAMLITMQVLADVGLFVLLVRWFGLRPGILPPLALYLFCVISFPVAIWWAAGVNQLPLQVVLFWALPAHVKYLQTGRMRHAWFVIAWLVGGLLFFEKTVLVLGAIGIISLAWFTTGTLRQRVTSLWNDYRPGFVAYIVLGASYLLVYYNYALNFDPTATGKAGLPDVFSNMIFHAYVPSMVGGPLSWSALDQFSLPNTGTLTILGSVALVGLVVRELARSRRRGLRALWLPTFFLGCNIILVFTGRASFVGPLIALDFRYQGELAAVTAIALACATMPIRGAVEPVEVTGASVFFDHPRRVAAAVAAIAVLATVSCTEYINHWSSTMPAKSYFANLIGTIEKNPYPAPMIDQQVPNTIMWGLGYPVNLQSHLLTPYVDAGQVDFTTVSVDQLAMSDPDGRVWPVAIPVIRQGLPGPTKDCGYSITAKPTKIAFDGPLAFGGWWIRLGYISSETTTGTFTVSGTRHHIVLPAGLHAVYVAGGDLFDSITVSVAKDAGRFCTNDVTVGRPEIAKAAS